MDVSRAWEENAAQWIAWARTPGHDAFWEQTWPALRRILPPPGARTLDLGCGEGRAGRLLVEMGHRVVGVDRSPTLARAAATAEPGLTVLLADAAVLPLADGCVDLVVACMSLLDIDDLEGAVREVRRVLRPGGSLCLTLVHPFLSAQDEETVHTDAFEVTRPYLEARRYVDRIERDRLPMTFVSMHRPLRAYTDALFSCGMVVSRLDEHGSGTVPWLLALRADLAG